jgi:hypothetical protein
MNTKEATRRKRSCWCATAEPKLGELMGDPMMIALMAADRVDRRDLTVLFDKTRVSLRRRVTD